MQCHHARELFSDYVGEEIESALAVSLENHLAACESCREDVAGLRRVWASLEQAPLVEPPRLFHANLMGRVDTLRAEEEEAAARKRAMRDWRSLFRPRTLAFGAAAAVLLLACFEMTQQRQNRAAEIGVLPTIEQHLPAVVRVQQVGSVWTARPDGSGTLLVRMRSEGVPRAGEVLYRVSVDGYPDSLAEGALTPNGETPVTLNFAQAPAGTPLHLSVKLTTADGRPLPPVSLEIPAPAAAPADPNQPAPQPANP